MLSIATCECCLAHTMAITLTEQHPRMGFLRKSEPYILGGSTLVLAQFNKMKDLVPVPYIGPALEVVQGIVDVIKVSHRARSRSEPPTEFYL